MSRTVKLILLCLLLLASCKPPVVDAGAVETAVSTQLERFPESRLQDLYKSFFQDRFGPGHLIADRESALRYILTELAEADTLMGPKTELCGWQGNYVRVNLSVIPEGQMTADEMVEALMASAKEVTKDDIERWKTEWVQIEAIIEKSHPNLPDLAEDKAKIKELLNAGQYACHHNPAYETAYHPHYRIILTKQLNPLINR